MNVSQKKKLSGTYILTVGKFPNNIRSRTANVANN